MNEQEFWSIWQASSAQTQDLNYRLYYDDQGYPLFYSMEQLPGNYIEIDRETFVASPKYIKVVNGKIKNTNQPWLRKIVPDTATGTTCSPFDVTVVVSQDQANTKWDYKYE